MNQTILPDFSKPGVQSEFFYDVLMAAEGLNDYRFMCYGGAAGGGKTFTTMSALITLCIIYPGSRWAVFRASYTNMLETTIPSIGRILGENPNWKFSGGVGASWTHIPSGSKIMFMSENINADPDLNHILGLEINGAVLEQAEEMSSMLFDVLQTRVGRWKLSGRMPKPIILMTLNPAQTWVKEVFFEPYIKEQLKAPFYFKQATLEDNPHLTEDYKKSMYGMSNERERRRLVFGDWTNFIDQNKLWAYSFNREKHVAKDIGDVKWSGDPSLHLILSFDFNVNPMACGVFQIGGGEYRCIEMIKLANSDIYKMCQYIKVKYGNRFHYWVTGDASGLNATAMVRDNLNYYRIIKNELGLTEACFKLQTKNPPLEDNQVLVNAVLEKINVKIHPEKAKWLIWDLENVQSSPDGGILKSNRNDQKQQADALDAFRYFTNQFLKTAVQM